MSPAPVYSLTFARGCGLVIAFALCMNPAERVVCAVAARQSSAGARRPSLNVERRALEAARKLIADSQDYAIVIIDPELSADPSAVRRLDAFTVREADGVLRQKVYINSESQILQQAVRGVDFYVKVLAAVIVHEIEHLKGGSEETARAAEQRFLQSLIARGLVASKDGRRYLALLRNQPREDRER